MSTTVVINNGLDVNDTLSVVETAPVVVFQFGVVRVFQVLIGFIGVFGNLACVIILRKHSVSNNTNWLIFNQAVIDCITSFILIATVISEGCGIQYVRMLPLAREIYCKLWNSFLLVFSGFAISTFNLVVLSIERYIAVVHPIWYLHHFKKRAIYILGAATWLLGPIFQFLLVFFHYDVSPEGRCRYTPRYVGILVMVFVWDYFIPACIMTFSFVAIVRKFRALNKVANDRGAGEFRRPNLMAIPSTSVYPTRAKPTMVACEATESPPEAVVTVSHAVNKSTQQLQVPNADRAVPPPRSQQDSSEDRSFPGDPDRSDRTERNQDSTPSQQMGSEQPRRSKAAGMLQRRNTTKVLLVMYLLYLICWSPNQWTFLQFNLGGYLNFESGWYRFLVIMGNLNACVNPFLFAFRLKVYQAEIRIMFQSCCGRN